jgi:hypothetical protein
MSIISSSLGGAKKWYILITVILLAIALVLYFLFFNRSFINDNIINGVDDVITKISVDELTQENVDYSLNSSAYPQGAITVISNMEESENNKWQGGGVFDENTVFEGNRSLGLVSIDHNEIISYLKKDFDLSNKEYLVLMVDLSNDTGFEEFNLKLGDLEMKNYYLYSFSNLKLGWNLLQIPKRQFSANIEDEVVFDWGKIKRVQFTLQSRPGAVLMVNVDMIRGVNNNFDIAKDWRVPDQAEKEFLGLYEAGSKTKLLARNLGVNRGILYSANAERDFIYIASVSPQSIGRSGLFVRGNYNNGKGYYFLIGGVRNNRWQVMKFTADNKWETLSEGDMGNTVFLNNSEYWLRVEARKDKFRFLSSLDGKDYTELAEITDNEFKSGGLGITVLDPYGWSIFDNFMVKKL